MGFKLEGQTRPKRHGILKTTFGLKLGEPVEKKRRGRRRREEKKERRSIQASQRYGTWIFGMKTNLDYEFHEIWHVSLGLHDDYFAQT